MKKKKTNLKVLYKDEQVVISKRTYADGTFRILSEPRTRKKMRRL